MEGGECPGVAMMSDPGVVPGARPGGGVPTSQHPLKTYEYHLRLDRPPIMPSGPRFTVFLLARSMLAVTSSVISVTAHVTQSTFRVTRIWHAS